DDTEHGENTQRHPVGGHDSKDPAPPERSNRTRARRTEGAIDEWPPEEEAGQNEEHRDTTVEHGGVPLDEPGSGLGTEPADDRSSVMDHDHHGRKGTNRLESGEMRATRSRSGSVSRILCRNDRHR